MIYKSSSLLSENVNKDFSLNRMAQTPQSYTVCVLQLNEELQRIETDYNINRYRALKEAALNEMAVISLNEGIMSNIGNAIHKAIEAIVNFVKNIINTIRGKKKIADEAAAKAEQALENAKKNDPEAVKKIEGQSYDNLIFYKSISNVNANALKDAGHILITEISNIIDGKKSEENAVDYQLRNICYTELSKSLLSGQPIDGIRDRGTFRAHVSKTLLASERKSATGKEFIDYYDKFVKAEHGGSQETSLNDFRKMLEDFDQEIKRKSANSEIEDIEVNNAMSRINILKELSDDWSWFIVLNENNRKAGSDYFSATLGRMIAFNDVNKEDEKKNSDPVNNDKEEKIGESTTIHGEIFDSETLFANEDPRDFNSTEWLDLELTTECYSISCAAMETRRSMALQEAIIMSEDAPGIETFRKLCVMQEVEMNKFRDNISKIIANIKEFISKFISEIQDKYGKDAALMKKYGDSIKKNPIKLGDAKTTGNIIEGIERLNADKALPSFAPETMNEKEKLDMFEKHFLSLFSDSTDSKVRSVQWNRDVESPITNFCKAYYGASMPEEKYTPITYTSDNLEAVKTKLIDFVTNPHIFFHKIKMNLSKLEAEAKKIGRTTIVANNTNTNQNNNQNTNNNQQNANNNSNNTQSTSEASFYSVLYDRWFNEVDFASGNPSPSGSDNKDNANTNNNELESAKDFAKTYVEIVKDILLSKLTAARFIYAECMAIMRAHAKMYNNKAVVNNANNNTQQQNQNVKK